MVNLSSRSLHAVSGVPGVVADVVVRGLSGSPVTNDVPHLVYDDVGSVCFEQDLHKSLSVVQILYDTPCDAVCTHLEFVSTSAVEPLHFNPDHLDPGLNLLGLHETIAVGGHLVID